MSVESAAPASALTPTSYLVLGMLAREGPSTPYDLKREVSATIGNFWSFPHALLYKEPPRLVELGLLTEERERDGRRRRIFAITAAGQLALRTWLARPAREPTQLRDAGLLQLFFADLGSADERRDLAVAQLAIHRAALSGYQRLDLLDGASRDSKPGGRTMAQWRGATLPMGLLYEQAAVRFWEGVLGAAADDAAGVRTRDQDELVRTSANGTPPAAARAR